MRIVVEAEGIVAARGGWIEIGDEPVIAAPDVVVRRLVELSGRVIDRQGQPVVAATVSNSGDGHRRVAAATDAAGRFRLQGVAEGDIFLFAEKSGHRFTGILWQSAEGEPSLTLSSVAEHVEPLRTLAPLLSRAEEVALAGRLLDPYLAEVREAGTDKQKCDAIEALAGIDPIAAFDIVDALNIREATYRDFARIWVAEAYVRSAALSLDDAQSVIEATENEVSVVHQYMLTVARLDDDDRRRRLAWLDQASIHARSIRESAERVRALAWVADGLFAAGDSKAANSIVAELEPTALEVLDSGASSTRAREGIALALVHEHPRRALEWLERIKDDFHYQETAGKLATALLPDQPDLAEEVWERAIERGRQRPNAMHPWWRYRPVSDVCYLMAGVDRQRALDLARRGDNAALRIRGLAAVAEAINQTDPAAARELLASIVREKLPQMVAEDINWYRFSSPPVTAAWLLPIAERVDAELARECFWRALALRSSRPRLDDFDDAMQTGDDLIKKVARYDRRIARFLLQPSVARLPECSRAAASDNDIPAGRFGTIDAKWMIRYVADTAVHVSPAWSAELVASLPKAAGKSGFSPRNEAIVWVAIALSLAGDDRWTTPGPNALSACFWRPPRKPVEIIDLFR
jgi:hypothetical protein